ncbi:unnamed protein product [Protopolystoma xenopodis]|uniref:Uncharacterized protein n=1 Tax=Protopolystoma xenopodis TaxID=117903 RepID=A0A3S4ZZW8_9PLAT|nr:unnamed protein product [Protopolystoma xenopodis]
MSPSSTGTCSDRIEPIESSLTTVWFTRIAVHTASFGSRFHSHNRPTASVCSADNPSTSTRPTQRVVDSSRRPLKP